MNSPAMSAECFNSDSCLLDIVQSRLLCTGKQTLNEHLPDMLAAWLTLMCALQPNELKSTNTLSRVLGNLTGLTKLILQQCSLCSLCLMALQPC